MILQVSNVLGQTLWVLFILCDTETISMDLLASSTEWWWGLRCNIYIESIFLAVKKPHTNARQYCCTGRGKFSTWENYQILNMWGPGNQCYSKTSFTPHTKASLSAYFDSPLWLQGVTEACLGGGFVAWKQIILHSLLPKSNKPEGIGRDLTICISRKKMKMCLL